MADSTDTRYVTTKQLYDELQGTRDRLDARAEQLDAKIDGKTTELGRELATVKLGIKVLVPANAALLWKVFGTPAPEEVASAIVRFFGVG